MKKLSIEEFINDNKEYYSVKNDYSSARLMYKIKLNDKKFIFDKDVERARLRKNIEDGTVSVNFYSQALTVALFILTTFVNGIFYLASYDKNYFLTNYGVYVYGLLGVITLISIYRVKGRIGQRIIYSHLCLEVLDDIEKEMKTKTERLMNNEVAATVEKDE